MLILLAGSNGAGKTTFYEEFLSDFGLEFVNADVIANNRPLDPAELAYEAAAMAEVRRQELLQPRHSFIMETVFSDPSGAKLEVLRQAQASGYFLETIFIGLNSPALSASRVHMRTLVGGHSVPPEKITSRYPRTLTNLGRLLDRKVAALTYEQLTELTPSLPRWALDLKLALRTTDQTQILTSPPCYAR